MKVKKQIVLIIAMLLLPLAASADYFSVEIDGIYYDLYADSEQAMVTSNPNKYSGSVNIPSTVSYDGVTYSVTSIGWNAFERCSKLISVTIPNSVTSIKPYAFYYSSGLTSVNIPNSVTTIGNDAFCGCSSLTSVNIPNSLTSIEDEVFCECRNLTSITIPNSVTRIGSWAFRLCSRLYSVTIPNSVTSIGEDAFSATGWYNSQSDELLYLDNWLLDYKGTRPSGELVIKEGTRGIAGCAFKKCKDLTSVTIPNTVTSIGYEAFYECRGLTSITIPNSVTSIGEYAFIYTGWWENQPDGLVYLDNWLLGYKPIDTLGEVVIKEGTKGIADCALSSCDIMTSITIPNSVTSIGVAAFQYCSGLTSIIIPNSVTSIGEQAFRLCSRLYSVNIPNSVTSIGELTFAGCNGLTSITIPNSVTSIGEAAFIECSGLTSVTIPNSVKSIGSMAFVDCRNLLEVYSYIKKPFDISHLDSPAFLYSDYEEYYLDIHPATLFVPKGTKRKYEATKGWKKFANIVEMDGPAAIEGDLNGDDEVDVTDVVELIDMVLAGIYDAVGDINGDGEVDVTDVVELIDMVLAGE